MIVTFAKLALKLTTVDQRRNGNIIIREVNTEFLRQDPDTSEVLGQVQEDLADYARGLAGLDIRRNQWDPEQADLATPISGLSRNPKS